jgi:mitochondrial chaperone BCS1
MVSIFETSLIHNLEMEQFIKAIQANPILMSSIGLWAAGLATYASRNLPYQLWQMIKNKFVISVHLKDSDIIFKRFDNWYEETVYGKRTRTLRVKSVFVDNREIFNFRPGYGKHYFFWKGRPFMFIKVVNDSGKSEYRPPREEIEIFTISRSQKPLRGLLESLQHEETNMNTNMYYWNESTWEFANEQPIRSLSSIFMQDEKKQSTVQFLETFYQDKRWYHQHGIPYRTGLLLQGPPGTGKTSYVRALCSHFQKPLYVISLASHTDESIQQAFNLLPDDIFVLIEDVDSYNATLKRTSTKEAQPLLTLAGLLNAIDGVSSSNGRVLIMTSNHPEALDPALIRPGRVDLSIYMGELDQNTFVQAFKNFYPSFTLPQDLELSKKISPATLQSWVKQHRERPETVLELSTRIGH